MKKPLNITINRRKIYKNTQKMKRALSLNPNLIRLTSETRRQEREEEAGILEEAK